MSGRTTTFRVQYEIAARFKSHQARLDFVLRKMGYRRHASVRKCPPTGWRNLNFIASQKARREWERNRRKPRLRVLPN